MTAGIRIAGPDGDGGRIPDLTVWSQPQQTVTVHRLDADRNYAMTAKVPLAWLLQTAPGDHHIG